MEYLHMLSTCGMIVLRLQLTFRRKVWCRRPQERRRIQRCMFFLKQGILRCPLSMSSKYQRRLEILLGKSFFCSFFVFDRSSSLLKTVL